MPPRTLAHAEPEVLRWARESAGYSVHEAADKVGVPWWRLEAAEEGSDLLTLREAERAAKAYERPLAALFLPAPPQEEPQETQFRRLPGSPEPPWPPEMQLLARRIRGRQDAAAELYEALEEEPPWRESAQKFATANPRSLPGFARDALGVSRDEQENWSDGYAALRGWTDAVEALGILVMQDGSMTVDEMRGFASIHPTVPAIVVNTKDDERARAFTVVHEFGHLVLAATVPVERQTELWCNEFAGEVLMPPDRLADVFRASQAETLLGRVEEVAHSFSVTPLAAAVRVARSGLTSKAEADRVITYVRRRGEDAEQVGGGGDYYLNQIAWFGPGFIRLVFDALDNQAVTYPTASALLGGVKVNNFDRLRGQLSARA